MLLLGTVTVSGVLDRETRSQYRLVVVASDSTHSSSTQLVITLLDVNDEAPEFSQDLYSFTIPETASVGKCYLFAAEVIIL